MPWKRFSGGWKRATGVGSFLLSDVSNARNNVRVQISARHCELPSGERERVEEQVASLSKFSPRASHAEVVFTEEKHGKDVEVIVYIDGSDPVVAKAEGADFRSATDAVVDRAGRLLRKQRERRIDHKAPPLGESLP